MPPTPCAVMLARGVIPLKIATLGSALLHAGAVTRFRERRSDDRGRPGNSQKTGEGWEITKRAATLKGRPGDG
jgi:hypothetical protein